MKKLIFLEIWDVPWRISMDTIRRGTFMYELFSEHISDKHRSKTPFPPGCILYKEDCETDEEAQDILDNKKYRTIVGKVLWACRGVYPECAYGCSQLSKVL